MDFTTSDLELELIKQRIDENRIDLQPDFQRGEVWSLSKKQRLIDTVLRNWYIPPIHIIKRDDVNEVLDGQQRLSAIRDFMDDKFKVDGSLPPSDAQIRKLDGLKFSELPDQYKEQFKQFTLRQLTLKDFKPDEPYELFFRLNSPTNLVEAEKRNAFNSEARQQVKELVDDAQDIGFTKEILGFGPSRMAYDDLIARTLVTVENRNLSIKTTAARITDRYRNERPFDDEHIQLVRHSIGITVTALKNDSAQAIRPNKATIYSWLLLGCQNFRAWATNAELQEVIIKIERLRKNSAFEEDEINGQLLTIFQDRSTARVNDVLSVQLRNLVALWFLAQTANSAELKEMLHETVNRIVKEEAAGGLLRQLDILYKGSW